MRLIPDDARHELAGAQFILGAQYVDWMWQERARQSIAPPPPSKAWPFRRAENVIQIASRKKR